MLSDFVKRILFFFNPLALSGLSDYYLNTVNTIMQIFLTGKASIYDEIVESIKKYIAIGALKEGEKLPSVRELALSLSVNPNTVARAYDVLTQEGYLLSIPKKGCFVAAQKADKNAGLRAVLQEAIKNGTTPDEIRAIIDEIEKGDKQ